MAKSDSVKGGNMVQQKLPQNASQAPRGTAHNCQKAHVPFWLIHEPHFFDKLKAMSSRASLAGEREVQVCFYLLNKTTYEVAWRNASHLLRLMPVKSNLGSYQFPNCVRYQDCPSLQEETDVMLEQVFCSNPV